MRSSVPDNMTARLLQRLYRRFDDYLRIWQSNRLNFAPALAINSDTPLPKQSQWDDLLDILHRPWLMAVQRNRRSVEKRRMRRFREKFFDLTKHKKNIVVCLNCGTYHESDTICGNCYAKVREETERMRTAMGEDTYYYNQPAEEVAYVYEDDDKQAPMYRGRTIIEMQKKRPEWFPPNLKNKV